MAERNDTGTLGENLAKEYLISQGYKILEENWHFHHYEIDLIATKDEFIIFVEVKTRSNISFGKPELFVDRAKQNRIITSANAYVSMKKVTKEARLDIISIIIKDGKSNVEHIPNAFYKRVGKR
jgi:putative endonuclease